jgi:hypothetical protein
MVSKENVTPSIEASCLVKVLKNGLELRKLWPPTVKKHHELNKNKPPSSTKLKLNHPKKICMLFCCD